MKTTVPSLKKIITAIENGTLEIPKELDVLLDKALAAVDARNSKPSPDALRSALLRMVAATPTTTANLIAQAQVEFSKCTRVEIQSAVLRLLDSGELIWDKNRMLNLSVSKSTS